MNIVDLSGGVGLAQVISLTLEKTKLQLSLGYYKDLRTWLDGENTQPTDYESNTQLLVFGTVGLMALNSF